MTAELYITDGSTSIDLLAAESGYHLADWQQQITTYKGGGIYQDSPLTSGRQLIDKYFSDATEGFTLRANASSQDAIFYDFQELVRLLEKATDFWTTDWQNTPVYLQVKSSAETNTRYAIIKNYQIGPLPNPLGGSFNQLNCGALYDEFVLSIERGDWTANPPGDDAGVAISASESYNSRTLGFDTATTDPIVIANRRTEANLTHIFNYDDNIATFSANLLDAALPTTLFPIGAAVDDIVYFGIDTSVGDSGPFSNLAFDIGTPAAATTSYDMAFEYWNGAAWTAVSSESSVNINGTDQDSDEFLSDTGLTILTHSAQIVGNWATTTVNSITGYWFRVRISALTGTFTNPTQQNRDIFVPAWNYIRVPSDQVGGDIPALARMLYQTMTFLGTDSVIDRLIVGMRSEERGANFTSIINIADEQNPSGIVISTGTNTSFVDDPAAPTGRRGLYNPGGVESMATRITLSFTSTISNHFHGTFRLFLRAQQRDGTDGDISVRAAIGASDTIAVTLNETVTFVDDSNGELVDLGQVNLPATDNPSEFTTEFQIFIQAASTSGAANLYLYDIVLIPVDEWSGEFINPYSPDFFLTAIGTGTNRLSAEYDHKDDHTKATVLSQSDEASILFRSIAPGPFVLKSSKNQRLWMIAAYRKTIVTLPFWAVLFENVGVIQLFANQRYRSGRGAQ